MRLRSPEQVTPRSSMARIKARLPLRIFFGALLLYGGFVWSQTPMQAGGSSKPISEDKTLPSKSQDEIPRSAKAPKLDEDNHTKLLADTHLLLKLTRDLKADMAKGTQDTLSLGILKRLEVIQKLAATVAAETAKMQ